MENITWQTKLSIILVETLFISFLATLFLNTTVYLFSALTGLPQTNWALLGRWINSILHGQLIIPSIATIPGFHHDTALGISTHLLVSFIFVFIYLAICTLPKMRKIPAVISGTTYGFMLMLFPLLIEYPSMGISVLSEEAPYISLILMKIFTCHSFFGVGIALGRGCLEYIRDAHVSTAVV
jgi:hypothetical protein